MKYKTKSNLFWTSYTDLMTSLFFVMLVLYVLTYVALRQKNKATEDQLRQIKELQAAVKNLPQKYFSYDSTYKRFILKEQIQFRIEKSDIKPQYVDYLKGVGLSIERLIDTLKTRYKDKDIRYLIVIEGMASNDNYQYNNELSYARALALYNLWNSQGIHFDPNICEVQIAGSGIRGVGRDKKEVRNQRFLIQIIPKTGEIKL
ncbi:MAG: OmpA family protein [Arcicella sp.]|jgi:outer membrane protein OmpA-like peptidoglycan-associated protein|nr:OmpA family protein [Arcicella sp.]